MTFTPRMQRNSSASSLRKLLRRHEQQFGSSAKVLSMAQIMEQPPLHWQELSAGQLQELKDSSKTGSGSILELKSGTEELKETSPKPGPSKTHLVIVLSISTELNPSLHKLSLGSPSPQWQSAVFAELSNLNLKFPESRCSYKFTTASYSKCLLEMFDRSCSPGLERLWKFLSRTRLPS